MIFEELFSRRMLPNALTFSRLPLGLLLLFGAWSGWPIWVLMLVFNVGAITDFFDGYFSRRFDAQTDFGRIFDPVFDKLLMWSAYLLICLLTVDLTWILLSALFVFREWLTDGFKGFLLSIKQVVPANRLAKVKTVCQIIMVDGVLLYLLSGWVICYWLAVSAGVLGVIYAFVSAWQYFALFAAQFPFNQRAGLKYGGTLGLVGYWAFAANFWATITSAFLLSIVKFMIDKPESLMIAVIWLALLLFLAYWSWQASRRWQNFDPVFDPTPANSFVAGKLPGVLLAAWPFWVSLQWNWPLLFLSLAIFVAFNYAKKIFKPFWNDQADARQLFWSDMAGAAFVLVVVFVLGLI